MSEKKYFTGVEATMSVIGGKWKPIILCHLRKNGVLRTSELLRNIPKISQKMLISQLRELENDGIVERIVYQEVPPRVEYAISEYGKSLEDVLDKMCAWGEQWQKRGV